MSGFAICGHQLIDDDAVEFALALIENSDKVCELEESLQFSTGRKRELNAKAILVGLLILALDNRPLYLSLVTNVLYFGISTTMKERLGITRSINDNREFLCAYRRVRYMFHLICSQLDPSDLQKNRCIDNELLQSSRKYRNQEELELAGTRLFELCNSLLEQSLRQLSNDELSSYNGSVGLDATVVPLFSRGPSKRSDTCASDPDGGWYVREGDHRDKSGPDGKGFTKIAWALEATIVTMGRIKTDGPPTHPNLALGFLMTKPGIDPGGSGIKVLRNVKGRGYPTGFVGADRAYSNAPAASFHLPLRALGYLPIMDYRIDHLAIQANSNGALLVEGSWYCPNMAKPLIDASKDFRNNDIDKDTYTARISARKDYLLSRKQRPDHDGYERYSCPALGEHPKLRCELRPSSMLVRNGQITVKDPPKLRPAICLQGSITISPAIGAKDRQELRFATPEWGKQYATLRNSIEGLNGFIKDPSHECLSQPGRRRVRGIAPQSIFVAMLLISANMRKIHSHQQKLEEYQSQKLKRPKRRQDSITNYA